PARLGPDLDGGREVAFRLLFRLALLGRGRGRVPHHELGSGFEYDEAAFPAGGGERLDQGFPDATLTLLAPTRPGAPRGDLGPGQPRHEGDKALDPVLVEEEADEVFA